jgi:AcrR family transcriptional regulator
MNLAAEEASPSQSRRTQAERSALSDARMLDAAVRLIVERGTAGTTLKDVGERAGYSRGLASARFGSKAALFSFIVRAVGEEWLEALREAVRDQGGLPAICAATDAHYRYVRDGAERIRAFYCLWFDSIGPDADLKQVIANVHERRQRDVEAWIRQGIAEGGVRADVDVGAVARQFCAAIIGIVYQWLVAPDAHRLIEDLHTGLKLQMQRALAVRDTTGGPG